MNMKVDSGMKEMTMWLQTTRDEKDSTVHYGVKGAQNFTLHDRSMDRRPYVMFTTQKPTKPPDLSLSSASPPTMFVRSAAS